MLDLALIGSVAGHEAAKQQTDLAGLVRLLQAYQWAYRQGSKLNEHWLGQVAHLVEPRNAYPGIGYRRTPVTFTNGGRAVSPDSIRTAMDQWFWIANGPTAEPDWITKELLAIHPWIDGNGRVAWIVRTRLTDTWRKPLPLPNYFGV